MGKKCHSSLSKLVKNPFFALEPCFCASGCVKVTDVWPVMSADHQIFQMLNRQLIAMLVFDEILKREARSQSTEPWAMVNAIRSSKTMEGYDETTCASARTVTSKLLGVTLGKLAMMKNL
ncbi:unnamed protein product [Aphanomyces euteiches]